MIDLKIILSEIRQQRQISWYNLEKEKYKHLNADFQRIARRDKKAFFSNQCKEIDENNRMGKKRSL